MPYISFKRKAIEALPAGLWCALMLAPFGFLLFQLSPDLPKDPRIFRVLLMTFLQASLSAMFSVSLGLLACRGLLAFAGNRLYPLIEGLCLLPILAPPLLTALSLIHLTEVFMAFPFGLPALIFASSISCVGFCAVALTRAVIGKIGPLSEWVLLHTASPWVFLINLLKGPLLKDIKILFILVFVACWSGLSLPLLLSGRADFSLEFFIYEQIKDPQASAQAPALILLQSAFIFGLCFWSFLGRPAPAPYFSRQKIHLLPQSAYLLVPLLALFLALGGLAFVTSAKAFLRLEPLWPLVLLAGRNSLIVGLGVGLLTLAGLSLMSLSYQSGGLRRFAASFTPPGVSFMGFSLLLLPFYSEGAVLLKWVLGLSLLLFPWVYRWRGERALESVNLQAETARFMGAGAGLVFRAVIWPQCRGLFLLCAGVSACWACGDFALSLMTAGSSWNLSLLVYDLLSSYRLDMAVLLSWLLLGISFFVLLLYSGLGFIFDKKILKFNRQSL